MNLLNIGVSHTGVFEHFKQSWKMLMSSIEMKTPNLRSQNGLEMISFLLCYCNLRSNQWNKISLQL